MVFDDFSNFIATSIPFNLAAIGAYSFVKKDEWQNWIINKIFLEFKSKSIDSERKQIDDLRTIIFEDSFVAAANKCADEIERSSNEAVKKHKEARDKPIALWWPNACIFFIFQALVLLFIDGFDSEYTNQLAILWSMVSFVGSCVIMIKKEPSHIFVIYTALVSLVALFGMFFGNKFFLARHKALIIYDPDTWYIKILSLVSFFGFIWYVATLIIRRWYLQVYSWRLNRKSKKIYKDFMKLNAHFEPKTKK